MNKLLLHAATLAVAALSVTLAQAQTGASRKVDRNELRTCLDTGDSLKARNDELKARSERLNALNAELKTENEQLQREIERQERSSSMMGMARDRLDRRKTAYDQKVAAARRRTWVNPGRRTRARRPSPAAVPRE